MSNQTHQNRPPPTCNKQKPGSFESKSITGWEHSHLISAAPQLIVNRARKISTKEQRI